VQKSRVLQVRGVKGKAPSLLRVLGGTEFVERVLRESDEEWERRSLLRQRGVNLKRLWEKVADHFGVETEYLKSGSKDPAVAKTRAVLCYVGGTQTWTNLRLCC